jgi:hypothetical protein
MSLSNLASIGSLISSTAVILSIIFLALQIRQANRNQRSLIQQARTDRNVLILLKMTEPAVSEMLAEADGQRVAPNPAKIWSFYGFAAAVFWSYEDTFMQQRAGTLHPDSWRSDVATLRRLIAHPSYRAVWKMARDGMSGRYRDYVDELMDEIPPDRARHFGELFSACLAQELADS